MTHVAAIVSITLGLAVFGSAALLPDSTAAQGVDCPRSQCLECAEVHLRNLAGPEFGYYCVTCRPIKNCSPSVTKSEGQSATTNNPAVEAFGKKRPKLIRVKPSGGN